MFEDVYRYDPDGAWAAAALYRAGLLYNGLYQHSYRQADQKEGVCLFEKVVSDYSGSAYQDRAVAALEAIGTAGRPEIARADPATSRQESRVVEREAGPVAAEYKRIGWRNPRRCQ